MHRDIQQRGSMCRVCFACVAAGTLCASSLGAVIPITAGTASGSGATAIGNLADSQPVTDPAAGNTAAAFGGQYDFFGQTGRAGYVDFGAAYASVTINSVFVGLKQFGTAPSVTTANYWWSPDISITFNSGAGDVSAPDFGLLTATGNSNQQWVQTYTGPVTPAARYYILKLDAGGVGNRLSEGVFVGTVPEPTIVASIAGLGALALRRRTRAH